MAMARWLKKTGVVASLGLGVWGGMVPGPSFGQERERDVTITGPRGRSIERHFESRVGPNGIDRDLTIRRPGGTFERQTHIGGAPGFVGGRPGGWGGGGFGPRPGYFGPPVFIRGGGGVSAGEAFGIGALGAAVGTGAGLLLGKALSSPPPPAPVYVTPAPVVVGPAPLIVSPPQPPVVVYNPPVRYLQAQPPTLTVDPVAQAIGRLSSNHDNSRKEGALVLGRLGDARAVPALIDRLKNDRNKDVRIASATALGEIGDPRGAVVLERAIIYDKRQDVRDAASSALARMPREVPASANGAPVTSSAASAPTDLRPIQVEPAEAVPPPPSPAFPGRRN
jgi:hypothetical protein